MQRINARRGQRKKESKGQHCDTSINSAPLPFREPAKKAVRVLRGKNQEFCLLSGMPLCVIICNLGKSIKKGPSLKLQKDQLRKLGKIATGKAFV